MESNSSSNKKIKIVTKIDNVSTSASLKNISGNTNFGSLKQLAQILVFNQKDQAGLYYLDKEIDINSEEATIDEIFSDLSEITIEIKLKKSVNTVLNENKILNSKSVFSACNKHPQEYSKFYCETCKLSICFRCTISNIHKNHQIFEKFSFYEKKFNSLNEKHQNITGILEKDITVSNNMKSLRSEQIEKINYDFDQIVKNTLDVKSFYLQFFSEYYDFLENKVSHINEEYTQMNNEFLHLQNKFSMESEFYYQNLDKIRKMENDINQFLVKYKNFTEFKNLNSEFNFDYEVNINSLLHKLELVKLEYFTERKLKIYDKFTTTENEQMLISKYLNEFVENYQKVQNSLTLPIPLTKKVLTYDFDKNEFNSLQIGEKNYNFKFFDYSRYVNSGDYIFVTGGLENDKELNNCYICSMKDSTVLHLSNMRRPRSQHSLVYANFNQSIKLIFAISGYKNPHIEIFNPKTNSWINFKSLSNSRCNANVLFVDNNSYMYIFGGSDEDRYLSNSFEKINLSSFITDFNSNIIETSYKHSFEKGSFIIPSNLSTIINLNYSGFGIIPLGADKFYVVGGFNSENDDQTTDELRLFEYEAQSLKIQNKLNTESKEVETIPMSSCFYSQEFLRVKDGLTYAQFNAGGNILTFNSSNMEFDSITNTLSI